MKGIYDFSRNPAHCDCTVAGLKALKGSGTKLSMSNPADRSQITAAGRTPPDQSRNPCAFTRVSG